MESTEVGDMLRIAEMLHRIKRSRGWFEYTGKDVA